jgi:hypothetical protein
VRRARKLGCQQPSPSCAGGAEAAASRLAPAAAGHPGERRRRSRGAAGRQPRRRRRARRAAGLCGCPRRARPPGAGRRALVLRRPGWAGWRVGQARARVRARQCGPAPAPLGGSGGSVAHWPRACSEVPTCAREPVILRTCRTEPDPVEGLGSMRSAPRTSDSSLWQPRCCVPRACRAGGGCNRTRMHCLRVQTPVCRLPLPNFNHNRVLRGSVSVASGRRRRGPGA